MHIDLKDYQPNAYVVIRDTIPWGLAKRSLRYQGADISGIGANELEEFYDIIIRKMVKEWSIKDESGNLIPKPDEIASEQIDELDARIVGKIISESQKRINSQTESDPN